MNGSYSSISFSARIKSRSCLASGAFFMRRNDFNAIDAVEMTAFCMGMESRS